MNDSAKSREILNVLLKRNPDDREAYFLLVQVNNWSKQYKKNIQLLEDWLKRFPEDSVASRELNHLKQIF